MAGNHTASRLYEQFTPRERVTLVLEAMARGDQTEATRLRSTCPRKTYTMIDAAVADRLEMSFDRMAVVCIDLRCMWGQLQLLHDTMNALDTLTAQHHHAATLAFLDGVRFGKGKPPFDPSSLRDRDARDDEAADEAADEDGAGDEVEEDESGVGGEEEEPGTDLGPRLDAVTRRSAEATGWMRQVLVNTAEPIAQDLIDLWAALGRFSQAHLGVDAKTLLLAWQFAAMHDFNAMVNRYRHLTPREAKVAEYAGYLEAVWVERFGEGKLRVGGT